MIRVDMTSPDLDKQIELLKFYPEVLAKHFTPALKRSVKALESRIRPTIPVLSGRAQETFRSKVTGKGINLTGAVGWFGKSAPWYIKFVEQGTKAHKITPKRPGGVLSFDGRYAKVVQHPGISARGFMAAGFSATQGTINADLAQANEGVLKDLALNRRRT